MLSFWVQSPRGLLNYRKISGSQVHILVTLDIACLMLLIAYEDVFA